VVTDFVSNRMLDPGVGLLTGGYTTVDASLGYQLQRWRVLLNGYNLGNRRNPVAASELSETVTVTGTAGYYRLPARSYALSLTFAL
jgi:outer membrane receptor protein involved in Fe transport